ncbi:MAG: hypothetical protein ABIO82_01585 [Ginsengibacter sp.]
MIILKNKIVWLLFSSCLMLGLTSSAQYASSKHATAFLSPSVKARLAENTAKKSRQQAQALPSSDPKLKEKAKGKIRNPLRASHVSSSLQGDDGKKKLPSNSKDLKTKGHPKKNP